MTETISSFQEALEASKAYKKRRLLTGNGFSIACRPNIFLYGKLFEQADFARLSPEAKRAFEVLGTNDFERVIRCLRDAKLLISLYAKEPEAKERMEKDADGLRELLVQTIAKSHPERPSDITEEEYTACQSFLSHFETVYTLNYDLLLYWTKMHVPEGSKQTSDDGFRKDVRNYEAEYVVWEPSQSHDQNIFYLHGALHVFDAGTKVQKYTWVNTGIRLIEQIREALSREYYPLFVAEGTSDEKLTRIRHSDYLAKAYRSFTEIGGALFIYGHSLAENDEHFLRLIEQGSLEHLFIGIYGDPATPENGAIIARAKKMVSNRTGRKGLKVDFFSSESAKVWGR